MQFIIGQPPLWQVLREGCSNEQDVALDLKDLEESGDRVETKKARHRTEFHCYHIIKAKHHFWSCVVDGYSFCEPLHLRDKLSWPICRQGKGTLEGSKACQKEQS